MGEGAKTTDLLFPQRPARSIQREGKRAFQRTQTKDDTKESERERERENTYDKRVVLRFQLLQPPTYPQNCTYKRAKR
jgi:hypothetical protein